MLVSVELTTASSVWCAHDLTTLTPSLSVEREELRTFYNPEAIMYIIHTFLSLRKLYWNNSKKPSSLEVRQNTQSLHPNADTHATERSHTLSTPHETQDGPPLVLRCQTVNVFILDKARLQLDYQVRSLLTFPEPKKQVVF